MDDLELVYFEVRGQGEFIRLLLHAAGQKFKDTRVSNEPFGPEEKSKTPYGQLPYLVYKGKKYGQSLAIATFLAKKLGFYGKTDVDELRIDEVNQLCGDIRPILRQYRKASEEEKPKLLQNLREKTFPHFLGHFERLLVENGSTGYFVGKSLCLSDLIIYDILDSVFTRDENAIRDFPCLQKLRQNVESDPNVKQYLASRPYYPF